MRVEIVDVTEYPAQVISEAAGMSYGKDDVSWNRVRRCYVQGHMSVFEHAKVTFRVRGISRACSHQLVRHRLASFVQQSQRYVRVDVDSKDWYVTPPRMVNVPEYSDHMRSCAVRYQDALLNGIAPEDARYLLPEATATNVVVTMNLRELWHFFDLRMDKHAQWEIRDLAGLMFNSIKLYIAGNDEWYRLMELYGNKKAV